MNTLAAYLIVIAVWATTPLGIKWSGEALPAFADAHPAKQPDADV